ELLTRAGLSHRMRPYLIVACALARRPHHLPLKGGGIGGLWPPFLAPRTPMRSIGYGAPLRAGWGSRGTALETPPRRSPRLAATLPHSGGGISESQSNPALHMSTRPYAIALSAACLRLIRHAAAQGTRAVLSGLCRDRRPQAMRMR